MSILNVDKIQPIGGGSTITVDATDIQASTGTITANSYTGVDNTLKVSIGGTEYVRTHSTGQVSIGSTFMWRTDNVAQVYGKSPDLSLSRFNDQFMIAGNETSGAINTGAGIQFFGHDGVQERGMAYIRGLKENGTSGNRASYLAFATRPASGTLEERLRITSDGKFSLGAINTSPAAGVHIDIETNNLLMLDNTTGSTQKIFFAQNGSPHAQIYATSASGAFTIESDPDNNHGSSLINFRVDGSERLRIDANGNMALGKGSASSTNYGTNFQIHSSATNGAALHLTDGTTGGGTGDGFHIISTSGNAYLWQRENAHMIFATNGTERARILSGGNVLIGTTTDSTQKLTLYGTNAAVIYQGANTGTGVGQGFITGNNGNVNGFVWNYENGFIHFGTNSTERLRIAANGDMGLGTSTIENFGGGHVTLEVAGSTTSQGGVFKTATSDSAGTGSSGTEMIMFTDNTKGAINVVSADPLTFSTANTERTRIQSDGKFGIGDFSSTSVAQQLHVRGSEPKIYLEHTGGYDMTLTTSDGMGQNGITVNGGALSLAYNNKNIWMCRAGGNVGINSTAPKEKLDVSGAINAGGENSPVFQIRNDPGTYIRAFKHYFDASKGQIAGYTSNRTIVNITIDESFHQAGFEVTYFTRLQAVSDTQVRPNKIIFGVNRFNSANSVNVTKTVVEQHSEAASHCDVNVVSVSGTNYQIQMQFSTQPNVSSAAGGWIEGATVLSARFADVDYYYGART